MPLLEQRLGPAVLVAGLLLSAAAAWQQHRSRAQALGAETRRLAVEATSRAVGLLERAESGLRGTRGFVFGAGEALSADRFRAYVATRDMAREFPAVAGFGFVRRVAPAAEIEFLEAVRRNGQSGFTIRARGPNLGERRVVEFAAPASWAESALGQDLAAEPAWRHAGDLALAATGPVLSSPSRGADPAGAPAEVVALMLLALPAGSAPGGFGIDAGPGGWVYAPIRLDALQRAANVAPDRLAVVIADVTDAQHPVEFGASAAAGQAIGDAVAIEHEVMGRRWRIRARPLPPLAEALGGPTPQAVWAAGAAVTVLGAVLLQAGAVSRRRTREVLAQRQRLLSMLDHAGDAAIGLDTDGRVNLWNRAAERLLGYAAAEAMQRPLADLCLTPEQAAADEQLLRDAAAGRVPPAFETRYRHRDGTLVDVELASGPVFDADQQLAGVVKLLRPTRERLAQVSRLTAHGQELERQVAERTSQLSERTRQLAQVSQDLLAVLDAMPAMIGSWDAQLRNRFANRALAEFLGREPAALVGVPLAELVSPSRYARNQPYIEAVLRGEAQRFESEQTAAGTGPRHLVVNYVPQRENSAVVGFYTLIHDVTEIVESKLALANSQREQKSLLDALNRFALVTITDRRGTILSANDAFCAVSKFSPEDLVGQNHRIVNSGVHEREFWAQMWRTIGAGDAWRGEICNRAKDGTLYWVSSIIVPIVDVAGHIERFVSIRFEVTLLKQTEQALRRSEAMLARTSAMAHVGGFEVEWASGEISWSDETCRIYGVPAGYRPTMSELIEFCAPEARNVLAAAFQRAVAERQGWDLELPCVRTDGAPIWVRVLGEPVLGGERAVRIVGTNQDISVQHAAKLALEREQVLTQAMLESAPVAVRVAALHNHRVHLVNDRYCRLVGRPREAASRLDIETLYVSAGEREEIRQRLAAGEVIDDRLAELHVPDQPAAPHVWALGSYRLVDYHGEPAELAWLYDVTELRQARDAARRSEERMLRALELAESASRAKTDFLASTSHEIRTPLNAILGLTYLLERSALNADVREQVRGIAQAGRSLLALINDVLDLSKIESGQIELEEVDFDLPALVEGEMSLLAAGVREKNLKTTVQVDDDVPPYVRGDSARLRQILYNLVGNALKFTESGSVALRVSRGPSEPLLAIEISDTGIGIAPQAQARVFKPFEQADASTGRRYGGTGLGLSITAKLVERMGGTIALSSAPGIGSTFTLVLPLPASATVTSGADAAGGADEPFRVLLAEDDDAQREGLAHLARSLGWRCRVVETGHAFIEAALAAATHGRPYDAVLVDWGLPDLDGLSALADLRRRLPAAQWPAAAIVISQFGPEELRAAPHAEMASALLAKPVNGSALFDAVSRSAPALADAGRRRLASSIGRSGDFMWLQGLSILVVDDSTINLDVARKVLELEGAAVTTCESGGEALQVLQGMPDAFDAVVLDVQMPGIDGTETARRLRQLPGLAELPVIALSAGVLREERDSALAAGMTDFLPKPLDPRRLVHCLRRHVERRRGAPVALVPRAQPGAAEDAEPALRIDGIDESAITASLRRDRALVLSMIRRLLAEHTDIATAAVDTLPPRLHKLKSSARIVGALALASMAAELDDRLRRADLDDVAALQQSVADELRAIAGSAAPILRQEDERMAAQHEREASSAGALALDPAALAGLRSLIEQHSTRATKRVDDLAASLAGALGAQRLAELRAALEDFDFGGALRILDR